MLRYGTVDRVDRVHRQGRAAADEDATHKESIPQISVAVAAPFAGHSAHAPITGTTEQPQSVYNNNLLIVHGLHGLGAAAGGG